MLVVILIFPVFVKSQESMGLIGGNYAGIQAARINPSLINGQKVYFNAQLISNTAFFQNNFAYLPHEDVNLWGLIFGSDTLPIYGTKHNNYRYYDNEQLKNGLLIANVYGPSAMISTKNSSFGFHIAARSYNSATDIPYEFPVFATEYQGYAPLHHIIFVDKNFQVANLAWSEVGLTYATKILDQYDHRIDFGITLNALFGVSGSFLKVYNINYEVIDGNTVDINHLDLDAGFALPVDYNTNEFTFDPSRIKGKGLGADIGFTYSRMKSNWRSENTRRLCENKYNDYYWRLGISLLDFGSVRFNKKAELHQGRNIDIYWNRVDTLNFENINQLVHDASEIFLGDPKASFTADNFLISLPAALSMQFDFHYLDNLYLNAIIVQPLAISEFSVRRQATITFTPRYESANVEFGVPMSLYKNSNPRLGAYIGFGYFTIGTERLGVLLGMNNIDGLDLYFSLKFGFLKGKCYRNPDTGACFNADNHVNKRY